MERKINGELLNIPEHVAVIMDGNGRWAKKRMMPRQFGHSEGAKAIERACENADELGIKYLTVYAFSTENWKRSVEEVSAIMNIFRKYLVDSIERSNRENMRVRVIGKKENLPEDIIEKIDNLEKETAANTGLQFTVAINYGGRDEITRAVKNIARRCMAGDISIDDIDEDLVSSNLDTWELPDPDLLIRTSGEMRTSNFLPWQLAYSEFYFTDVLWPDFDMENLIEAVRYYSGRDRRFGGVKK
jgi:undecaprenyl diphosphate synthase